MTPKSSIFAGVAGIATLGIMTSFATHTPDSAAPSAHQAGMHAAAPSVPAAWAVLPLRDRRARIHRCLGAAPYIATDPTTTEAFRACLLVDPDAGQP